MAEDPKFILPRLFAVDLQKWVKQHTCLQSFAFKRWSSSLISWSKMPQKKKDEVMPTPGTTLCTYHTARQEKQIFRVHVNLFQAPKISGLFRIPVRNRRGRVRKSGENSSRATFFFFYQFFEYLKSCGLHFCQNRITYSVTILRHQDPESDAQWIVSLKDSRETTKDCPVLFLQQLVEM